MELSEEERGAERGRGREIDLEREEEGGRGRERLKEGGRARSLGGKK